MKAWAVVENGAPLECIEVATPDPVGTEVLIEVTHCGVCHSDVHFWKGSYDLGGGKYMTLKDRGVTLPRAPGHEIVGRVAALGPDASGVAVGDVRVVYPWLGCGACERCRDERDNLCTAQRSLGVLQHGGFGSHVVVPHPRYLVDIDGLDPALAATYACSGITVLSAIRKVMPLSPTDPVVLIGAGGLGLAAIAMLCAHGHEAIICVDTSAEKRAAALATGATAAIDGAGAASSASILEAAGGPVKAVIDFVNAGATARFAFDALAKGGKLIPVGLAGGEITLSLAGMVFRSVSVEGCLTGNPQDLRDVVALAKSGRLGPIPVATRAKRSANAALADLRDGRVTGRIILTGAP